MIIRKLSAIILILAFSLPAFGQDEPVEPSDTSESKEITIEHADIFSFNKKSGIRKLLHNVIFSQDSAKMYCDSAYHHVDSNFIEAFSNVRIFLGNDVSIFADRLQYDGETKVAELFDNITLTDGKTKLTTDRLTFYRKENYGLYYSGGKLEDAENVLTSVTGYYYPGRKMAYFKKDVKLVNPDYVLTTDTLGYNTELETAYFLAPTFVEDEENLLYTENGYYNTITGEAFLHGHPWMRDSTYSIFADTLFYNNVTDLGWAKHDIILRQNDSTIIIYGHYGEFHKITDISYITDSAYAVQVMDEDTIFLFADTLYATRDTSTEKKTLRAYHDVRMFMQDLQAITDSLVYHYDDSLIYFYSDPVLWSEENQMTGDTIVAWMKNQKVDSMLFAGHGFIISREDTVGYNQISGKHIYAKFRDDDLVRMQVVGNSRSIYFAKDEKEKYIGMNQALSTEMFIRLQENKPVRITFIDKPEGTFYPIHEIIFKENRLEGFVWRIEERPVKPEKALVKFGKEKMNQ